MERLSFRRNESMGLGVEVELQLIHRETRDLYPVGPRVLEALGPEEQRIKSEIFQSMLEIDTPICQTASEAALSLRDSWQRVTTVADQMGADVMMSGTHPFANYNDRLLTPSGRYFELMDRNQWIAKRLQIFGLHVHLGMRDGDHAIAMNNALSHYLPLVLALSASSPFWHGEDTGLSSSRITFFEAIPTGGHPCMFEDWASFEKIVHVLKISKSITSLKDLWWDVRPNIEYGTLEVRIADCPPTLAETEALVCLIHSLALSIDEDLRSGKRYSAPPEWMLRENKWRASRHGPEASFVVNREGELSSAKNVFQQLEPLIRKTQSADLAHRVVSLIHEIFERGCSSERQRKSHRGSSRLVVEHLITEGRAGHPLWI